MHRKYYYSLLAYLVLVLYPLLGSKFIDAGNNYQTDLVHKSSILMMLFIFVFGAIAETLVLNYAIIYYLKTTKFFERKNYLILFIASLIFGLAHFSSIKFVIITFFAGAILNINFLYYINKTNNYWYASLSTFIIHLFSNLTIYIIDINT